MRSNTETMLSSNVASRSRPSSRRGCRGPVAATAIYPSRRPCDRGLGDSTLTAKKTTEHRLGVARRRRGRRRWRLLLGRRWQLAGDDVVGAAFCTATFEPAGGSKPLEHL